MAAIRSTMQTKLGAKYDSGYVSFVEGTAVTVLQAVPLAMLESTTVDYSFRPYVVVSPHCIFGISFNKSNDLGIDMTLQELAQIGEFLGGASVLLTLIYLAVQLKGNTKAVRSTGAQQTHETLTGAYFELARDANLNRIFRIGTLNLSALNEDEKGQYFAFWSGVMYIVQNWLYQRDSGTLDEKLVHSFLGGVAANFHADGFEVYWDQRKYTFSVELQEWVEDIRARPPARSGHIPLGVSKP